MSSRGEADSDGNIQTFLRIRPSKHPSGFFSRDDLEKSSLAFNLPNNFKSETINNSKTSHSFHFNGIFDEKSTQDEIFKKVGVSAVMNAINGFNSTIFAYGQTGSGKTYTLTGDAEQYANRGIIPRAVSMLFKEFRSRADVQFRPYVSYLEIYNDVGYDLLNPSHSKVSLEELPKVSMLEDEHGNFHLKNLSMHAADTEEEALNWLFEGDMNRAVAETPMNMASSRSHCIFSMAIEARVVGTDRVRRSKLHLVDLAGSERVAKTNSSGALLSEAGHINKSLFFLERVIVALYEKATKGRSHIPYRDCMMTSVLRDSLGGNCKTIMVATINPEASHTEESLSTCKFAQRVSLIKNRALLNEETDPSMLIKRLKTELLNAREEVAFLKGESGEGDTLSPQELEDLRRLCRDYCYDADPMSTLNLGALTLTKIKDAFGVFKNLVQEAAQNGSGGRSGGEGGEDGLQQQIDDLRSQLVQRDEEIVILVNMVKKGKTADDVAASRQRRSLDLTNNSTGSGMNTAQAKASPSGSYIDDKPMTKGASERAVPAGLTYAQMQEAQAQRDRERKERLVREHLFGVPPPPDRSIFESSKGELLVSIGE